MEKQNFFKVYVVLVIFYLAFMSVFYFAGDESLYYRNSTSAIPEFAADNITGDITAGRVIEEKWINEVGIVEKIGVMLSDYDRTISGNVRIQVWDDTTEELLAEQVIAAEQIGLNQYVYIDMDKKRGLSEHALRMRITSDNGELGMSATALYHSAKDIKDAEFYMDGARVSGSLCIAVAGKEDVWTGKHFREIVIGGLLVFTAIYIVSMLFYRKGKKELLFTTGLAVKKYGFLIEQLVNRDFKVRYKRSILGIFWSFLNPLLTMSVQYVVFSQLFKADIENFPLYLLSGLVVFNFFNESVGLALGAIVYNASLITKVYVPKYIYPVTKVLSSAINFLIAMIPLFIVVLVTGEHITRAFLMLPYLMVCVIVFCIGLGMLMSALMVFFRDIQFLWGIISLLWMYMTPLFYPETIVAPQFRWILDGNAMYYYVRFIRTIVIGGVSPEPILYVQCALFSLGALLLGGIVFKKTQDKFVLNI